MVSKCANPECAASFRYFHTGKLFRVESPAVALHHAQDDGSIKKPVRRLEFFWLCDNCADKMSLSFEKGAGVAVRPKFARSATAV